MPVWGWMARVAVCLPICALALAASGCKTLNERYIALEVWKYEKCFGHLPPGFVPPGAAAAPPRVCGQGAPCQQACPPAPGCEGCQGGVVEGGLPPAGVGMPAGVGLPAGPGGSPGIGAGAGLPTPAGVTAGRPVVISDEVVIPEGARKPAGL
jgi:hypothetical protein